MERRIGRAFYSAREFVARFKRTPFERFQYGQMSEKEIMQRTHNGGDIIRRLDAALEATKGIPQERKLEAVLEAIRKSDIQSASEEHNSKNPPPTTV